MAKKYFFFASKSSLESLSVDVNARLTGAYYNGTTKSYPVALIPFANDVRTQVALILTAFEDRDAINLCSIESADNLPLYSAADLLTGAQHLRYATNYALAAKDEISWLDISENYTEFDVISLNEFRRSHLKEILCKIGHEQADTDFVDKLDWTLIDACWTKAEKAGRMSLDIYNEIIDIVERS